MSYFYKIKEISTGKFYIGCQYGICANSVNLGVTYFTPCRYVKQRPWSDFEICFIQERKDARAFEARYLRKCYNLLGRDRFCDLLINRNIAPGILNTRESIEKANIKRRVSNKKAAEKRIKDGTHNFLISKHTPTFEERHNSSIRMRGNTYGSLINRDEEYKKIQSINSKGNTNVRGKKWWTNGTERRRSISCPGEGWWQGSKLSEATQHVKIDR